MREAIALSDLFLPSFDDMVPLSETQDSEAMLAWSTKQSAQQIVLKLGEQGALLQGDRIRTTIKGHKVKSLDATGAGDCFAGNLLARLCTGDTLDQAASYANAAAALSVQGYGAVAPLPNPSQVENFRSRY